MRRALLLGLAVLGLGAAGLAPAAEARPAKPVKAGRVACAKPRALHFTRAAGAGAGQLVWRPGRHTPRGTRYRVLRGRAVVGQTKRTRMKVRVSVGKGYWLTVRPVTAKGRPQRCSTRLRTKIDYLPPDAPTGLTVQGGMDGTSVRISWSAAKPGESRVVGYRVMRNGRVLGQVRGLSIDIPVANDQRSVLTVAAVDARGKVSPASAPLRLDVGHLPPPAPTNVIASSISSTEITLSWSPSQPSRGSIRAYRVFRNGVPVTQTSGLSVRVTNLAPNQSYVWTVVAIDASGWLSAPSAPATLSTAPPVQTTGKAQAFLLASTDRSFEDFQAHYTQIGVVYPTYFDCGTGGQLLGRDDPLITGWARARGVKVLPRFNCQRTTVLHQILTDPNLRRAWLDGMVALVQQNGYDGVNVDFEAGAAADRAGMTSFITELASRLHGIGKLLSVAVSAKIRDEPNHPRSTFYDYAALSQQADWIFVMCWGYHWTTSGPGALDDFEWMGRVMNYVDTMPQHARFVLGLQLYGIDWPNGGGARNPGVALEYSAIQALLAQTGAQTSRDALSNSPHFSYTDAMGIHHDVWYSDATTTGDRIALARQHGLGIGFWRLGDEDQRIWSNPQVGPGP
jgi:spore germination protein YaaH